MTSIPTAVSARRDRVVRIVGERGHVIIAELAEELGVSEMTVRRDVAHLASENRVVSFYGGVRSNELGPTPGPYGLRATEEPRAKARIARRAAELVTRDTVVAIDAGSTAAKLAQQLAASSGVRVVTASVPVISALMDADAIDLVALGGTLRRDTESFTGPSVVAAARDLHVDTFFLGAAALSARGAFDSTDVDAVVKRELIQVSARVVAIADSTKFGKRALSRICGWDAIDVLITDDRVDADTLAMLRAAGVDVMRVPLGG